MTDARPDLYQKMADMTLPECGTCHVPYSCCDEMYCTFTVDWARDVYGVELATTNHPKLPLMGPSGCTADPHYRPMCTLHTCNVSAFGGKRDDPTWNEAYHALRDKINIAETVA